MKQVLFILLMPILLTSNVLAQTSASAFTFTTAFSGLDANQNKVLSYVSNQPRTGNLNYLNWGVQSLVDGNGNIAVTLPNQNGGQPIVFEVVDTYFATATEYAIFGKSALGEIAIYVTPQGKGGTIDLLTTSYNVFPMGGNKGLLIERSPTEVEGVICGNVTAPDNVVGYCREDCGKDIVDVLAMLTPGAQTWVNSTWGMFGQWFLFVETNNINGAFVNSAVSNKRVRVRIINYTPDFTLTTNMDTDMNSFRNNPVAKQLALQNGADIRVLLTDQDYPGAGGPFGGMPIDQFDPTTTNKVAIVEVPFIGSIRYTFAHEVAHHFGCWHSIPTIAGCPNGKNMMNGKNTIMANSPSNTRIQHFSNPSISFGGESTGTVGTRNNAAQILGAFCEVANNNSPAINSVDFEYDICNNNLSAYVSQITDGWYQSYGVEWSCTGPYSYQWSWSLSPSFSVSYNIGSNSPYLDVTTPYCPQFYLRVTITSSTGCVATQTKTIKCQSKPCEGQGDRNSDLSVSIGRNQIIPNPATDQIKVLVQGVGEVVGLSVVNAAGVTKQISQFSKSTEGEITCNTAGLQSGVWFLQVHGSEKNLTLKFAIVR
jgi:Secretion system C-terminal sorting domain/Metallo-peptidase family M12B Reprolysin-like